MSKQPSTPKRESVAVKEARKFIADFPASYNAHHDSLTDPYEHRETVNRLLWLLRGVLAEK